MPRPIPEPTRSRLFLTTTALSILLLWSVAHLAEHPAEAVALGERIDEARWEAGVVMGYVFGGIR